MTSRSNGTTTIDAMTPQFGDVNEPSYESKIDWKPSRNTFRLNLLGQLI